MKVLGYVRVSTEEQATGGVSLDAQKAKIIAYAQLYELELVETIVDAGQSAKSLKRPGLSRALELLKKKKAEGLIITKLDRLSRSIRDWNTLIDDHFGEKAGRKLFSVGDSIDTRSAAGRLVLNVLMSVSQWEREAIGERTRDALRHKKSLGQRVGKVPFGYTLAGDGVALIPHQPEQQTITRMNQLRKRGMTLRAIAEELTRMKVPTKEGKPVWTHTAVGRILGRS